MRSLLSAPRVAHALRSKHVSCAAAVSLAFVLSANEGQAFAQSAPTEPASSEQEATDAPETVTPTNEERKIDEDGKNDENKKNNEALEGQKGEAAEKRDEVRRDDEAKEEEAPPPKEALDTSVESAKAIFFSGDFGFTRSDLGGISDSTGFDRTAANGLLYGLSAGLRLRDVRLGARWRVYDTTESTLWTFALSAGYGLPIRPISPVFSAHVGYVFDQHIEESMFRKSLPPGALMPPNVDVRGLLVGVDINASYWVTQFLRVGAFIGADLMFLHRDQATLPRSIFGIPSEFESNPLYSSSGSSIGLNLNAGLRGAFDIAFK